MDPTESNDITIMNHYIRILLNLHDLIFTFLTPRRTSNLSTYRTMISEFKVLFPGRSKVFFEQSSGWSARKMFSDTV